MRVVVIANPVSGGGEGKVRGDALCTALERLGATVEYQVTSCAGDGLRFARNTGGADCVAVVGGDGTLHEVVNGLPAGGPALAVLPAGSANVVAREFRIPPDPQRVAQWILHNPPRPMDLLDVDGHRVILGAGAGLDAAIAAEVKSKRGSKSSVYHWVLPGIRKALTYDYPGVRVIVDGNVVAESSPYVVVGNCRYSAGVFPATRRAEIDDGVADVVAITKLNACRLALIAGAVWLPSFPQRKDVVYVQGREVVLESAEERPVALQADGDPAGETPVRITVLEKILRVVTP